MCSSCPTKSLSYETNNIETNNIETKSEIPNVFLDNKSLKNNLIGTLSGSIKFAQTHTIDPSGNSIKEMPRLVSTRDTLVMFIPSKKITSVELQIKDKLGNLLKKCNMDSPDKLPKADRPDNAKNPDCIYHDNAWSSILLADWVQPGLKLIFTSNTGDSGVLEDIDIGPETQVIIQNIRIGMLTNYNSLENNLMEYHTRILAKDYFQKIPVSELIVGNYEPIELKEVVLSSGVKYTDKSSENGGVYDGDLRENIGKALFSMGIDNANFGINSSKGGDGWQGELTHMVTAHQSWGNYQNGRVQHGLSGGYGMATLYDTHGNEFSHEVGHTYGMGHWPGGGKWCTHSTYSGWGWERNKNKFIANFFWDKNGSVTETEGGYKHTTEPFLGVYQFNRDTMAGGTPSSIISQYTHHTGYTQKRIQERLENRAVITPVSDTGYLVWDENNKKMVSKSGGYFRKPDKFGVPVVTLIGYYDPEQKLESYIYPALHGSYGYTYKPEPLNSGDFYIKVTYKDESSDVFGVQSKRLQNGHMNRFHINVQESKEPVLVEVFNNNNNKITAKKVDKYSIMPMPYAKVGKIYGQDEVDTADSSYDIPIINNQIIEKEYIIDLFKKYDVLKINITSDKWSPEVNIPDILDDGKIIKISSTANLDTHIIYNEKDLFIKNGYKTTFSSVALWEENKTSSNIAEYYDVPVKNGTNILSEDLSRLFKLYDKLKVTMWNGHWASTITMPGISKIGQEFMCETTATSSTTLITDNDILNIKGTVLSFKAVSYWDVYIDEFENGSDEDDFFEIPFNNSDVINDSYLFDYQKKHNKLVINNTKTCWTPEVYLPDFIKNDQILKVTSVADKSTDIFYGGKKLSLKKNRLAIFNSRSNIDVTEDSFNDNVDDFYYIPITNDVNIEKHHISDALSKYDNVGINLKDGSWVKEIHMPDTAEENKKVKINSSAKYETSVFNGSDKLIIKSGDVINFDAKMFWIKNKM